ncbi:uncharacterized protein [Palaemon carinicauda]|uniref:uncharacterized protein n=1 Tax=Palaemon carinicauda TaxID=392227 RepID=UPI0035B58841
MRFHVFGNNPSPAVAMLGLRKTAQASGKYFGNRVTQFVSRNFYVDDGLTSCTMKEEAINLIKDTQKALAMYGNLRLHKIASNSEEVKKAFPANDLASNLKDLDLEADSKPLQGSLGLSWDVNTDKFLFQLSSENKPITRRGILSTVNSIYDPVGLLAPFIIHAVLAIEIAQYIIDNLDISIEIIKYHKDSKVVLGYINNEIRRFYQSGAHQKIL